MNISVVQFKFQKIKLNNIIVMNRQNNQYLKEICNTVKKSTSLFLLQRRAKAQNVSAVKYSFLQCYKFPLNIGYSITHTDTAQTSLPVSFHFHFMNKQILLTFPAFQRILLDWYWIDTGWFHELAPANWEIHVLLRILSLVH